MFGPGESHLVRYATRFDAVEINSSFYRRHRAATYARWAASVPDAFRFSVKLPKTITHTTRLGNADALLDEFLGDVSALGTKLGCVLVQLPPSLQLDAALAHCFLAALRERYGGMVALEPRHVTWFTRDAAALLAAYHVARVAADPPHAAEGGEPGGWTGAAYYRMHGSPRVYYTEYDRQQLARLAASIRERTEMGPVWCIFDNTAAGAAVPNALTLRQMLGD